MIRNPLAKLLLWPPATVYRELVRLRPLLYREKFFHTIQVKSRVISIGNLTVGGTGKTPFAMRVAELLRNSGHSVAILCGGYKRESAEAIVLVSDGKKRLVDAAVSGDEAQLFARSLNDVPVVVGSPKWKGALWIEANLLSDWIVLDDGFQHLKLFRDRNILLLDAGRPVEESRMVPLGRLREPIEAMQRADIVVMVGGPEKPDLEFFKKKFKPFCPEAEWFAARRQFAGISTADDTKWIPNDQWRGKKLVAFCGIARPEQFFRDLNERPIELAATVVFPDHTRYRRRELRRIIRRAVETQAEGMITTTKDAAKLDPRAFGNWPCYVCDIKMSIDEESRFFESLLKIPRRS